MKDYNQEYFYMDSTVANYLEFDGPYQIRNSFKFLKDESLDEKEIIPLRFEGTIPKGRKMADVYDLISNLVVSGKVKNLFEKLSLKDVQFIPTIIEDKKGKLIEEMLSLKPKGVAFYQLSTYNPSKRFQEEFTGRSVNPEGERMEHHSFFE